MSPSHNQLRVIEQCQISPLPSSPPPLSSLPLTFFDVVFLNFNPVQRLFFYDYPYPNSQFIASELPNLKHSLSLALHKFHPLAGTLTGGQNPQVLCRIDDSVSLTVVVSHDDFYNLAGNHPRAASRFHPLVPLLASSAVFAVQVTLFLNGGVTIGTALHHAVADGSAYTRFMKTWASACNLSNRSMPPQSPSYDRSKVLDPRGLRGIFLKDLEGTRSLDAWDLHGQASTVRATFVFGREQLRKLAARTQAQCSPYALACGYVWACLTRARGAQGSERKMEYFGFVTGCRPRHDPPLPANYFGNCLGICKVEAKRRDLVGDDGGAAAAEAIWRVIEGLQEEGGAFEKAESWMKDVFDYASKRALTVAGSPKLGIYEVDFGWGRARKVEVVSIERTGALSLAEMRDERGGIEVGLVLPENEMQKFISVFVEGMRHE